MKTVYGWVVVYNEENDYPRAIVDLFFSSKEKFKEEEAEGTLIDYKKAQLVPIKVPDDFNDLDCIPDNY